MKHYVINAYNKRCLPMYFQIIRLLDRVPGYGYSINNLWTCHKVLATKFINKTAAQQEIENICKFTFIHRSIHLEEVKE